MSSGLFVGAREAGDDLDAAMRDGDRVVVIGSGPTGAAAASELVRRGVKVTMLDSGRRRPPGVIVRAAGNTVFRWTSQAGLETGRETRSKSVTEWHSARAHGGRSSYWTGSVPRFAPEDFTAGAAVDERYRWPVTYDDVAPFYDEVEEIIGITGGRPLDTIPEPTVRHRQSMPDDWKVVSDSIADDDEGGRSLGVMPMAKGSPWMVALRATEFNSYDALVKPLLAAPEFSLFRGRHVLRLERSAPGGPVDTVVAMNRATASLERHRASAIVLAAGALDSTEILLRSRSTEHPRGLGNDTGVLGRYLHDHPRQWWRMRLSRPMRALSHPLYLTRGPLGAEDPLRTAGFTMGLGERTDRIRSWYRGMVETVGVLTFATVVPDERGRVELVGDERDPAGSDLAIDFSFDDSTHRLMDESREACLDTLRRAGLDAREEFALDVGAPGSSVHLGGTARMHASRDHGVVDGYNRVHDAPEVRVVDMSCFTTGPEKNPTLTATALALRSARQLAASLS